MKLQKIESKYFIISVAMADFQNCRDIPSAVNILMWDNTQIVAVLLAVVAD